MYDVNSIKDLALRALEKNKKNPDESRQIFMENIMDWSDNFSENLSNNMNSADAQSALRKIGQLWIEYCNMEISLHQFKSAVQIYENALSDHVAKSCVDIYLSYAKYCIERGKSSSAQKVFIKGLSANLTSQDSDEIWREFLKFMQSKSTTDLTIDQLYEAVKKEAKIDSISPPSSNFSLTPSMTITETDNKASLSNTHNDINASQENTTNTITPSYELNTNMNVANQSIKIEKGMESKNGVEGSNGNHLMSHEQADVKDTTDHFKFVKIPKLENVSGFTPEQICRIHLRRPSMLFLPPNKVPSPAVALESLSPEEIKTIEEFLNVTLPVCDKTTNHAVTAKYSLAWGEMLDLVESLWTVQALQERHFDSWFSDLKILHSKEEKLMMKVCAERLALSNTEETKSKNQMELQRFRNRCDVQIELLHAIINRTLLMLLLEQQRALYRSKLPSFSQTLIEKLERCTNESVLKGNDYDALYDSIATDVKIQQRVVSALLSLRWSALLSIRASPHANANSSVNTLPQSGQTASNKRNMALLGDNNIPTPSYTANAVTHLPTMNEDINDYYTPEAKKRRKKRRMLEIRSDPSTPSSGYGSNTAGGDGIGHARSFGMVDNSLLNGSSQRQASVSEWGQLGMVMPREHTGSFSRPHPTQSFHQSQPNYSQRSQPSAGRFMSNTMEINSSSHNPHFYDDSHLQSHHNIDSMPSYPSTVPTSVSNTQPMMQKQPTINQASIPLLQKLAAMLEEVKNNDLK